MHGDQQQTHSTASQPVGGGGASDLTGCWSPLGCWGLPSTANLPWSQHITAGAARPRDCYGFLYRRFYRTDMRCLLKLYTSLVCPLLEYGCCVWLPYQAKYVNLLEGVQTFAARLAAKQWSGDPATLKSQLGWPSLECRHNYLKLCLCRRIISWESLIPQAVFAPHPSTLLRHINSCPIFLPHVRTLPQALILCGCVERYPSPHYHYPVCVWLQEAFTIVSWVCNFCLFSLHYVALCFLFFGSFGFWFFGFLLFSFCCLPLYSFH